MLIKSDGAPMSIVHLIPGAGPRSFGAGPVALNLVIEQNLQGCAAELWSLDSEADRQWVAEYSGLPIDRFRRFESSWPSALMWSRAMERAAPAEAARVSLVHQHALWTGISHVTSTLHDKYGIPTVVTPHGALERWALRKSRWKKEIVLAMYEKRNLHCASCLHSCSGQEVAGFRDFGLDNPVAVIPNGISGDWLDSRGDAAAFRRRFKIPTDKRIILFLSRITPVKGLPLLLSALDMVRDSLGGWVVVIAGADEFDHQRRVMELANQLHLKESIVFTGLLVDQVKRDAFAAAGLFVLPTQRENFGIVIAEALGAGVPVLTTKGAPWENLVIHNCGWWTDVAADAIAVALKEAFLKTPLELQQMGQRGKELVAGEFSWKQSGKMTIELYRWLTGHGDRPDFVIMD